MTFIDDIIQARMWASAQLAESRVNSFMSRTGLRIDEVELVYFQRSGEVHPQWIGAVRLARERSERLKCVI
jgi:hypothetical protein